MTAAIHTDIAEPVARLKAIKETTQQTKEAKSGVSARLMTDISQHVPSATQVLAARLITRVGTGPRVCNLFVSNVPGPQVPMYLAGAVQVSNYGMAPLNNGMGLFIATPSYNGSMTFGVTSTREIMPDIAFFISCLNESFDELMKATQDIKPAIRKKARSGKKSKKAKKVPKSNVAQTGGVRSAS
jgi:hypothetical protein